jgi:RimJ/RimL family protein N-acetyltransferase
MRLEPLTQQHVDLLVELDRDPEVMRYINGGRPSSLAEVEATIRAALGHRWIARTREEDDFVGWFGLRPTGAAEYELGYRLRRDAWGRGLATEGARTLISLAFEARSAQRVWAQTMTVNARSRRVLEACGLRYVRTFHLDWDEPIEGSELGDVEYEVLASDDEVRRRRSAPSS